ncbi:MAG: hypothetical protein K1060chlam3_00951, partial [Candidatus Anoxychlamydiales bacterium]|nr:hypothetical protein [Candidatus Anoxychlamydiales bacterium]
MKKVNFYLKKLLFTCLCSICFFQVSKIESSEIPENNLRIIELFPNTWLDCPGIEPAIPSDYIMKFADYDFYMLWGKKEDLEIISKSKKGHDFPINSPVFNIALSETIIQTGPTSFSKENYSKEEIKELKKLELTDFVKHKTTWGDYPVLTITLKKTSGEKAYLAWIGLNSEGHVWEVNLISPLNKEKENAKLWNEFINNTKQLPEPEYFIARGMDMRDGYTNYKIATASMKV